MINNQLRCLFCDCIGLEVKIIKLIEVITCPSCYRLLDKRNVKRIPKKRVKK